MARRLSPRLWASLRPFGIGLQRPNNYAEFWHALRANRRQLPFAARILRDGVCDGCALGTSGLRDWTIEGVHLCNVRLRLLELNTMAGLDPGALGDVAALRALRPAQLRALGRLPFPMLRRAGDAGFRRVSWEQALDLAANRLGATDPLRSAAFVTSRGMPNETYYAVQKAVRALGSPHIDNAARVCHAPSTDGLKEALGVGATTCSYTDLIETDLVVFLGANPANNQPVTMKYLLHARRGGARVISVNPVREPGMERYWVPSDPESALFGTTMTDRFFQVATGGDLAFLCGTLKLLCERGWIDSAFVAAHTSGFEAMAAGLAALDWEALERGAGLPRSEMEAFARELHAAPRAVFVWSMGTTQHVCGEDTVRAIVDLALTGGFVGREGCGLMPIRGHSGVQGGAEMGCYATALPGHVPADAEHAAALSEQWGFTVPAGPGFTAPEMLDAAGRGELDALITVGGSFTEILPDPGAAQRALARIPLRVHLDIVLSPQMLVDPAETVLLLPATTRYEISGGVTETTTERRIVFSPEIPGRRVGEARPEWWALTELVARARPAVASHVRFDGTAAIRDEIARVVPFYAGIERLSMKGDQVQYGGRRLCEGWDFPTPDGRAHFSAVVPPAAVADDGRLRLSTRRGKQFNSIVQRDRDALTGARREDVLLSPEDLVRLGIADGALVLVRSDTGELRGRARSAPIRPGDCQVHWPEGNVLLAGDRRSPESGVPDYNARVSVEPAN